MDNVRTTVRYKPFGNSMVSLPTGVTHLLRSGDIPAQSVVVQFTVNNAALYAGWSGLSAGDNASLEIDPAFASAIGVRDSVPALVSIRTNVPHARLVAAESLDPNDWELVELHAAHIQDKIMQQTRCVALGQTMVVYPSSTSTAKLRITSLGAVNGPFALLAPDCEIAVAPKLRQQPDLAAPAILPINESTLSFTVRALALPHRKYPVSADDGCYCVYADVSMLPKDFATPYVTVTAIPGPNNPAAAHRNGAHDHSSKAKANATVVARLVDFRDGITNTAALSLELAAALTVHGLIGFPISISPPPPALARRPGGIFILPYAVSASTSLKINSADRKARAHALALALRHRWFPLAPANPLSPTTPLSTPITNYAQISPIPKVLPHGGLVRFAKCPDPAAWFPMSHADNDARPLRMAMDEDIVVAASMVPHLLAPAQSPLSTAIALDPAIDSVVLALTLSPNSGTLVYGNHGCGKTLLADCVSKVMAGHGYYVHRVACESLMNEQLPALQKGHIQKWIQTCAWHLPSLLVLDNLDKIMAADTEHHDSSKSAHAADTLVAHLERVRRQRGKDIVLLATSISRDSVSSVLHQCHVLDDLFHLQQPNKRARHALLTAFLGKRLSGDIAFDMGDLVSETEGYSPNDLKLLSDRISHETTFDHSPCKAAWTHVSRALAGFTPSNLAGVKLEKSTTKWSDVGGLGAAKSILLETLEWPTKYAPIFANSTLRLRLGILLYGHPGCGKTLLASAVAAQCGLNFISIKGPEILNKYIGASEQLVRDLFDRAQAAKPCVLFFDEFDSIAPKRGHDSTGVTDRVVNQMLTQMDGAEGLQGVYVLAATSRPDLIDPALLRPGRLDKSVLCGMPSPDERLDILRTISAKMDLDERVVLDDIADATDGFSGADLQGLCSSAHLKAVHMQLEAGRETDTNASGTGRPGVRFFQVGGHDPNSRVEHAHTALQVEQLAMANEPLSSTGTEAARSPTVCIRHQHFEDAFRDSKPSILKLEMAKLNAVYGEFASSRDGSMSDGSASNEIGGRVTLM